MKHLMKSMGHLGTVVMKNKGKILLGIGAIALAPVLRWALKRYPELRAEIEEAGEGEQKPNPPKPRRSKREVYEAPQVPPENLIRHR